MNKKETGDGSGNQIDQLVEAYRAFQDGNVSKEQADLLKKSGKLRFDPEGWHYIIEPAKLSHKLHLSSGEVRMQLISHGAATIGENELQLSPDMKPTGKKAMGSK